MRRFSSLSVLIVSLLAWPPCAGAGPLERLLWPEKRRLIVVFWDNTKSIPKEDRAVYRRTYEQLVSGLHPGDRLVLGEISSQTLTSFRPVIDREVPITHSNLGRETTTKRAQRELQEAFGYVRPDRGANESRILDALNVAQQLFEADRNRKTRWLLILSDMLEDSEEARFEKQTLTSAAVKSIVERRKARGSFPELRGVRVFVVGARGATSAKFFEVRGFWETYFKEAGAIMEPGWYMRDGLRFGD